MRILVGVVLALWTAPAFAQADCDPDDPSRCAQPLQKGQPAPFDGQLLTPALAIALGLKADRCDAYAALEASRAAELANIDKRLLERLRELDQKTCDQQTNLLQKRLDDALAAQGGPWFERPEFVVPVTFVATTAVWFLAIKGASLLHE